MLRDLRFVGRSLDDLKDFPQHIQQRVGRQLRSIQQGMEPLDWKPMKSIGAGVSELRVRDATGAFRLIYVAKFEEAIYVLHCFEKKSQKTSRLDLDVAAARYKAIVGGRHRAR